MGAMLLTLIANIAIGVRMWFGLQDPSAVAAIRGSYRWIELPASDPRWDLPRTWPETIYYGLRGRSAKDVRSVDLAVRSTDELVAYIAEHFPNVESLDFRGGAVTSQGLMALRNCPKIKSLDVAHTNVGDDLADLLPYLPNLSDLNVDGTNVTDAFAAAASRHDNLTFCDARLTDITPAAAEAWKAVRPPSFQVTTGLRDFAAAGVIRWADGEINRRFAGHWEVALYGPHVPEESEPWAEAHRKLADPRPRLPLLTSGLLTWLPQEFQSEPDGRYQFRLKLGDYDSEPVEFTITDGKPSVERVEFRMPVTRAVAEKY